MWFLLNYKFLMWDKLQKVIMVGHIRCSLCQTTEESNNHLIMGFAYVVQVWREVVVLTRLKNVWRGNIIEEGLKEWMNNPWVITLKSLPLILSCGIRLARSEKLFDDRLVLPLQCVTISLSILKNFP